jgi:hypothetical protein
MEDASKWYEGFKGEGRQRLVRFCLRSRLWGSRINDPVSLSKRILRHFAWIFAKMFELHPASLFDSKRLSAVAARKAPVFSVITLRIDT